MTIPSQVRHKGRSDLVVAVVVLLLGLGIALAFLWNLTRYGGIEFRGVATVGQITEATAPNSKRPARVSYRYEVGGHTFTGHSYVDDRFYESAKNHVGDKIALIYFRDYPRFSAVEGFNNSQNLWIYFLAAIIFVPLGFWLMVAWRHHGWKPEQSTSA